MPASSFNTGQVSVLGTATLIVAQNTGRHAVLITNTGTIAIYIGIDATVTASTGQLLPGVVGASISIPSKSAVYGISASTAETVTFLDV
jgi:hypothetical protein